jgi:hypothetical protein
MQHMPDKSEVQEVKDKQEPLGIVLRPQNK